jgi:hypothetical protein
MNLIYLRSGGKRPTYHLAAWQEFQKCERELGLTTMSRIAQSGYFRVPTLFLKIRGYFKANVEERGEKEGV